MVPKMALFRGNWGLDIRFHVRNPQKAHPWAEPHVLAYFASKSVQSRCCSELQEPKKNTKTNTFWCAKSRMRGNETPGRIVTNFCTGVEVHDVITCADLYYDRLWGLGVAGGGSIFGFLHRLTSSHLQHCRMKSGL